MYKNFVFLGLVIIILCSGFNKRNLTCYAIPLLDTIKKDTFAIDTVSVIKKFGPNEKYDLRKKEYRTIYMWGDNKKPIQINPLGGVIININKIYSHLNKIGKNSRRLQRVFNRELEQDKVELLWKPLTVDLTKLKGDSLFYFQMYFLPTSSFLENASYYEKVEYVTRSMRIYRDSATIIHERMRLPKWGDTKQQ